MGAGAIAGIVGGGVLLVGGGAVLYRAANNAVDEAMCPSASELARQSGGSIVAPDDQTICTAFASCGRRNIRACVSNFCSDNCSIYYQFSDGSQVMCTTGSCSNGDYSSGIYTCASRTVNLCQ